MMEMTDAAMSHLVEKAKIVVHDLRSVAAKAEEAAAQAAQNSGTPLGASELSAAGADIARRDHSSLAKKALQGQNTLPAYDQEVRKVFNVQFNPSQLMLNVIAEPATEIDQSTKQSVSTSSSDPKMCMTVTLLFDDVDAYDAFAGERYTSGFAVKGITNAVKMVKGDKPHSVQPQVEALLGALRNPYTRNISFEWADFVFIGQLTAVQAKYTMFSISGQPIRAQVMMRLQHEMDAVMLKNWYDNFNTVFGGASSSLTGAAQKVGNLLNIRL